MGMMRMKKTNTTSVLIRAFGYRMKYAPMI
ncbi:uncharacterized protein METZ01_LOCUS244183, partial [marine metagenome]